MKKSILLIAGIFVALMAFAQEKKQVKINKGDGTYELTVEKEVNGKKTTTTKTYNSREEMLADPDLKDMNVVVMDGSEKNIHFKSKDADGNYSKDQNSDHNVMVEVLVDGDESDAEHVMKMHNVMIIQGDEEASGSLDGATFEIKKDADGETQIFKDGEEIEGDVWVNEAGESYDIKRDEGKVIITNGESTFEWKGDHSFEFDFSNEEDGDHNVKVIKLKDSDGNVEWIEENGESVEVHTMVKSSGGEGAKVLMFTSEDGEVHEMDQEHVQVFVEKIEGGDGKKVSIKIIELLNIHIEEVEEGDFTNLMDSKSKELKVDEINYYPNPSDGKFSLEFNAPDKATSIQILGLDGREVYKEELSDFSGAYQNEIDLSRQKRGIYLLKIQQGSRVINKKIVIE
jgi:hypothetical protein